MDAIYSSSFDGPLLPSIQLVDALIIETKKNEYIFFGDNIHLISASDTYTRLKKCMALNKEEKKKEKPKVNIKAPNPKDVLPVINDISKQTVKTVSKVNKDVLKTVNGLRNKNQ